MKKILSIVNGNAMLLDPETLMVTPMNHKYIFSTYLVIERMFLASESMEYRYRQDGKTIVKNIEKGDVVLIFDDRFKNHVVVIKNKEVKENIVKKVEDAEAKEARNLTHAQFSDCESGCCKCN